MTCKVHWPFIYRLGTRWRIQKFVWQRGYYFSAGDDKVMQSYLSCILNCPINCLLVEGVRELICGHNSVIFFFFFFYLCFLPPFFFFFFLQKCVCFAFPFFF
uniref:Uncharacterized protein n=1 Tax=Opuntia streptacantha TaxID=393608 RepID=A0A7C8ZW95_OPUST